MRTDLAELRDAIRYGYATKHDLASAKREDVVAIKADPELVQYRFVPSSALKMDEEEEKPKVHDRSVTWRASDETPDSYGDIVRVKGWDLERFAKNGVILWAHQNDGLPLAKGSAWTRMGGDSAALMVKGDFFDAGVNEFADGVLRVIKAGGLPGASVGFRAGEINDPTNEKERKSIGLGPYGIEFVSGHELLENSVVPVPANPNALQERCLKALNGELEKWLRSGEKSPAFVREFREQFTANWVEAKRKTVVTVPEMPEPKAAAPQPDIEKDAIREDKQRLARTVDHLLKQSERLESERSRLSVENEQLRAQCAELRATVSELQKSGTGQAQQPPATERGAGAVETSDERGTEDRPVKDLLAAIQDFLSKR